MTRLAYIPNRIIDHNGIADGATVHVYLSGTTTHVNLYSDAEMTVPMANPFTVAAGAVFPTVYYDSSVDIKLTIVSALDDSIEEYDPYNPLSVSVNSPIVSVKTYGATGDGVTDDSAAFVAAIAALKAYALNPSPGNIYTGSPKLFIPAGHYYLGTTTLDITHTLVIEGEGSGWFGPSGGGCSRLRWAANTTGIRFQSYRTSGNTTVDGADHAASGGCELNRLMLEGGYTGTEGDYDAVVIRNAIRATDLYIKNWQGDGIKGWTGNVTDHGSYAGNVSTTRLIGVKVEACRVGFDFRGTDSSLIIYGGCEGYQNRQAGFIDENAAGGNQFISCHATYNGIAGGTMKTMCSYSGNRYAVKWGQETWVQTNAPSGTIADNTGWLYVSSGGVDSDHPAWTTGQTIWRAGGDYLTLPNCWNAVLDSCYSEGGGFSQFNIRTLIVGGTNVNLACRGGRRLMPTYDGLSYYQDGGAILNFKSDAGSSGIVAADYSDTGYGYALWLPGQALFMLAPAGQGYVFRTGSTGSPTEIGRLDGTALKLPSGSAIQINSQQVVGARQTGTPADATDLATAITLVNDLKAKLVTHGLIS